MNLEAFLARVSGEVKSAFCAVMCHNMCEAIRCGSERENMANMRILGIAPCFMAIAALFVSQPIAAQAGPVTHAEFDSAQNSATQTDNDAGGDAGASMGASAEASPLSDCDGTTAAMNRCLAARFDRAKIRQAEYVQAALGRLSDRPELAEMIRQSDAAFADYRQKECSAVWGDWKDGTIRTAQSLQCSITLTDRRTHDIWRNWLTYMDASPPILPEPGATK